MDIVKRINNYINNDQTELMAIRLMEYVDIADSETLNEANIISKIKNLLPKIGIHADIGEGLIQMLSKAGRDIGMLMFHAIRATAGNQQSKEKVKEIANKEITKEQLMDFLLKLDMATMHVLTGPIHMIDALTGWHIWANIEPTIKNDMEKIKKVIKYIKDVARKQSGDIRKRLKQYIRRLKQLFGLEKEPSLA